MGIWVTKSIAANTQSPVTAKVRVTQSTFTVSGLQPNSPYKFWVNGGDMTWACRTPGTKMGSSTLTSDDTGSMTIYYSAEIYPDTTPNQGDPGGAVKYHNMYLTDINGKISSQTIIKQFLTRK